LTSCKPVSFSKRTLLQGVSKKVSNICVCVCVCVCLCNRHDDVSQPIGLSLVLQEMPLIYDSYCRMRTDGQDKLNVRDRPTELNNFFARLLQLSLLRLTSDDRCAGLSGTVCVYSDGVALTVTPPATKQISKGAGCQCVNPNSFLQSMEINEFCNFGIALFVNVLITDVISTEPSG